MKTPSRRALRRHQRDRVIATRVAYRKAWDPTFMDHLDPAGQARHKAILGRTPTLCSCWMCGNPRRHQGEITRAEKIALIELREGKTHPDGEGVWHIVGKPSRS